MCVVSADNVNSGFRIEISYFGSICPDTRYNNPIYMFLIIVTIITRDEGADWLPHSHW